MPFAFDNVAPLVLAAVVGLCVGSFLNVVIHRLPKMLERGWREQCAELAGEAPAEAPAYNLIVPRSQCPSCGHKIGALENIPVVSYFVLRGHCLACRAPISARYPIVELLAAFLVVAAIVRFGVTPAALAACVFLWMLLALTLIDFDTQLLPDNLTLPLLWVGLLANVLGAAPIASLRDAVSGAIAGYLTLWLVDWLFKLIRGKEGMGYGDFKLLPRSAHGSAGRCCR
jgi:leader peptidase (prepilin peptidase)/N-methyltransferase